MTRKTVTITMPGEAPRDFHLEEAKAERFAADIRSQGGAAVIGPFRMDASLQAVLRRAGVDPANIR